MRLPGAQAERFHFVAVPAVPEQRCRREGNAGEPSRCGRSPPPGALPRTPVSRTRPAFPGGGQGEAGLRSEVETTLGQPVQPQVRENGVSAPPCRCQTCSGGPGAGLEKGPLLIVELLGGDSGPFTQPQDPLLGKDCKALDQLCLSTSTHSGFRAQTRWEGGGGWGWGWRVVLDGETKAAPTTAVRPRGHAGARAPLLLASQRPRNFQARITFSVLLLFASAPRLGRNHCFCFT